MNEVTDISLWKMILCLSEASDLINPMVVRHQKRVAYIVSRLATELNYDGQDINDVMMAAALHDIGVFSLHERMETLKFDYVEGVVPHAVAGFCLLKTFQPLKHAAELIRYHHFPWNKRHEIEFSSPTTMTLANLIYLADRIDISINYQNEILSQSSEVCDIISKNSGELFEPESVNAFIDLAKQESFWFDLSSNEIDSMLLSVCTEKPVAIDSVILKDLAKLFSRVIDFRSRYTALHSSGVASASLALAKKMGMSEMECNLMSLAGYLHDIGKVAVPKEILEKPDKLTANEYAQIKRHTYYSYHLLKKIPQFDTINKWISYHHECPSGTGYPFHIVDNNLPLGARIVAVADVFSAITEPRPYRKVMEYMQAKQVLDQMAANRQLDAEVVAVLLDDFYQQYEGNVVARRVASKEYALFDQQVKWMAD